MAKKKFITCGCSRFRINKGDPGSKGFPAGETEINFDNCECTVDGKRVTKAGRDNIKLAVKVTTRKGFELF